MRPRAACRLFALALMWAFATATQGRAIVGAPVGDGSWQADGADTSVLASAERTSLRAGRPARGSGPARPVVTTLPSPPSGLPAATKLSPGAPAPASCHPSRPLGASRSSRGPPANRLA